MNRQQVLEMLKLVGHSPGKALEITNDYERGDELARRYLQWVSQVIADESPYQVPSSLLQ